MKENFSYRKKVENLTDHAYLGNGAVQNAELLLLSRVRNVGPLDDPDATTAIKHQAIQKGFKGEAGHQADFIKAIFNEALRKDSLA